VSLLFRKELQYCTVLLLSDLMYFKGSCELRRASQRK
jgi:hypothetical protein